jgi:tetratricopeptide (TPR) repeat protein
MESLTHEQLAYIERHGKTKNPKTIAKDLKLELRHVQTALRDMGRVAPTRRTTSELWLPVVALLAIVILGFLAYFNNYDDSWHFDDFHTVLNSSAVHEPSFAAIYKANQYRQAINWVFAASWALHGMSVHGWHVENNIIHVGNGLLVYAFVLLTLLSPGAKGQSRWPHVVAAIAAAIFVLHPVQTQAVTYITQRTESLCATLYLGAMILYALARIRRAAGRATGSPEYASFPLAAAIAVMILSAALLGLAGKLGAFLVLSAFSGVGSVVAIGYFVSLKRADLIESLLFAGALLATLVACETKEIAGTIPGAILLWELIFMRPAANPAKADSKKLLERARDHVAAAPYAAMLALLPVLAVAAGLQVRLLLREGIERISDIREISGSEYFLTELNVLATYVRLYLLPYGQTLDYDYPKQSSLFGGPTFISLLCLVAVLALAWKKRRAQPVFLFSVLFMLGVLAPTSLFVLPDFIFEHRIYLPLAAAAFVTALLAEKVVRRVFRDDPFGRWALLGAATPLLAVLLFMTESRNKVWGSDGTLWTDAAEKAPNKPRPLTNLGLFYQNVEPQQAELLDGKHIGGQFQDGAGLGDPSVWVVRTIFPNMTKGPRQFNVRKADLKWGPVEWGGLEKAEIYYKKALELDHDYYKARNNYALCEIQLGVLAVENAGMARQFMAEHPKSRDVPKAEEAAKALERDAYRHFLTGEENLKTNVARHPEDNVSLNNLGNLYFAYLDRLDPAVSCVESSIAIDSRDPMIHAVLGEIHFTRGLERSDKGQRQEAISDYQHAVTAYTDYLSRSDRSESNYAHVLERKTKCEWAIVHGGDRPEPKPEGQGHPNNPFQNWQGMNQGHGSRWTPPAELVAQTAGS